jgi:hypothetical protein
MTPDNVVQFPIRPMSAAERAELKDTLDQVMETPRQREAQERLRPLKLWLIFAVRIVEMEKLGPDEDGWMLDQLRKYGADAREIANIFAIAVARLEAMEDDDVDDGGRAA